MRMDPRQFDFTRRKWHWYHLDEDIARKLSEHASSEELICVKATDSRAVYKFEDLYIKVCGSFRIKDLLFPAAREEFNVYSKLQKHNITTVQHLGWGRVGHYTALVTREWTPDVTDVSSFWYKMMYNVQDREEFLKELTVFLRELVNSPLRHGDFHFGNILYSPGQKSFALVDLHNVSIGKKRTIAGKAQMLSILAELRSGIRPQRMLDLFQEIAEIPASLAGETIRKCLINDAKALQHEWPRRVKQFLNGYSKFSDFVLFDGAVLLVKRDKLRCNMFDTAAARRGEYKTVRLSFGAALEQMLFSFYLSMLQVPHLPVIALSPNGTLYYPKLPDFAEKPSDREWINSYNEYLLCMGLYLEDYQQWHHCSNDQLLIADFSSMLAGMPDRSMFQPSYAAPQKWKVRKS